MIADVIGEQNILLHALLDSVERPGYMTLIQTLTGGLVTAVVGAAFAYFFSRRHSAKLKDRDFVYHIADSLLGKINSFETCCISYWSQDRNSLEDGQLEILIHAHFAHLRQYSNYFLESVDLPESTKNLFRGKVSELYDISMGGNFESSNRKKSRGAVMKITRKCSQLVPIVIQYKSAKEKPSKI